MMNNGLSPSIIAGIITYNPDLSDLENNIQVLLGQVNHIVVVDNASENQESIRLLCMINSEHITLISNNRNEGIACGLNQILDMAAKQGYEWYLSMDQDSLCDPQMVDKYMPYLKDPSIGILCPYVLNNHKIELETWRTLSGPEIEEIKEPLGCITSGSLTRTRYASQIGGYDNKLFIDGVDADFNIRMALMHHRILRVNSTYLLQKMGKGHEISWIKRLSDRTGQSWLARLSVSPVYSPLRLYYMSRNSEFLLWKYGKLAGKRLSRNWMRLQMLYYFLTYPRNISRREMVEAIFDGKHQAKEMICSIKHGGKE